MVRSATLIDHTLHLLLHRGHLGRGGHRLKDVRMHDLCVSHRLRLHLVYCAPGRYEVAIHPQSPGKPAFPPHLSGGKIPWITVTASLRLAQEPSKEYNIMLLQFFALSVMLTHIAHTLNPGLDTPAEGALVRSASSRMQRAISVASHTTLDAPRSPRATRQSNVRRKSRQARRCRVHWMAYCLGRRKV